MSDLVCSESYSDSTNHHASRASLFCLAIRSLECLQVCFDKTYVSAQRKSRISSLLRAARSVHAQLSPPVIANIYRLTSQDRQCGRARPPIYSFDSLSEQLVKT